MSLAEKGIIIRKTSEGDLREMYLISSDNREFHSVEFNPDYLAELFLSENRIMYSAVRKKKILGFITGRIAGGAARLETIYVREKFRRADIGSALIEKFFSCAKKNGAIDISAAVHGDNTPLIKFMESIGFAAESCTLNLRKKEL